MQKNFFDYIKELIPEKGSVFFNYDNHTSQNDVSLYSLANLLCGQKIEYAEAVTAYAWNVKEIWKYKFDTIGLMFFYYEGKEKWIHFSKNAFYGAICIVATRNGITFEEPEFEDLRQVWERKINNQETEEDKELTERENFESNFNDEWFVGYKFRERQRLKAEGKEYPEF